MNLGRMFYGGRVPDKKFLPTAFYWEVAEILITANHEISLFRKITKSLVLNKKTIQKNTDPNQPIIIFFNIWSEFMPGL
jgi:hypothetical protein